MQKKKTHAKKTKRKISHKIWMFEYNHPYQPIPNFFERKRIEEDTRKEIIGKLEKQT